MFRFDESHPHCLVAYDGGDHVADIAFYHELLRRWVARANRDERFGVILVTEPRDQAAGEYVRDVAFEEAYTKLLNDFRRDHKAEVEHGTVGYARVMPARWVNEQTATNPNFMDEADAATDRMSRYMWGVTGRLFGEVDDARAWLDTLMTAPPPAAAEPITPAPASQRVGLFYGSTTGVTEVAALEIQKAWAAQGMEPVAAVNIGMVKDLSALLAYDYLILGISTWNVGQMQDDWDIAFPQLDTLDFTGKQVALFGVGDQYGYADNYLDAVGVLGTKLIERGATLVGRWNDGLYEFAASQAFVEGVFMGLALDEIHQPQHSDRRIQQWVAQIIREFALQPAAPAGV